MTSRFLPCHAEPADSELLLVEGQSALHAVDQVRQRQTQAVLALQGKIPNVMTRSKHVVSQNEPCQQLFDVLGCGSGDECDATAMRYASVVILSDPDIDGAHSRYLLLLLFQHYLRPVVQARRLALVISPRYRLDPVSAGKRTEENLESSQFFWSDEEKQHYLDSHSAHNAGRMTLFKGLGSLTNQELSRWVVAKETRHEVALY